LTRTQEEKEYEQASSQGRLQRRNPTQLRGAIEVSGQRAEVNVANPAGIAVDGGTFIRHPRHQRL
jgi:filamentous hemagglutinin family protein